MHLYFVGLDVHNGGGEIVMEGKIPATRAALDHWIKTLPGGFFAT